MHWLMRLWLPICCVGLIACAPALEVHPGPRLSQEAAPLQAEQAGRYWWQLRFKLAWPEGEKPDFSRHLLIAEQLLLPVIEGHQRQLPLWRFHRRAARSPSGHQFSFIFLADADTARQINRQVTENPLTRWLLDRNMIERTRFDQRSKQELGLLEDTSDPAWPAEMQRSWPYFIMGASQTWLIMVQELSAQYALKGRVGYPELLKHYRKVDAALNTQWRENGQHAYLHHLSAVFGYQPIRIRSRDLKTF